MIHQLNFFTAFKKGLYFFRSKLVLLKIISNNKNYKNSFIKFNFNNTTIGANKISRIGYLKFFIVFINPSSIEIIGSQPRSFLTFSKLPYSMDSSSFLNKFLLTWTWIFKLNNFSITWIISFALWGIDDDKLYILIPFEISELTAATNAEDISSIKI